MIVAYETAEEIRQAKARYCRFVDTKAWDDFVHLAIPEATFTFRDLEGAVLHQFQSPREMVAASARLLEGARSSHRVSNSELAWQDAETVAAIWAMEDHIVFPPRDDEPALTMTGAGHYHETWTRFSGTWRLASLDLRRTLLDVRTAAADENVQLPPP